MNIEYPLVSVAIPCYNASTTLPFALASLLAQTYPNWECIVIDDGSTDNPERIVDVISDERIRFVRFEKNMGRAVARQRALDLSQGKYLCMIDADDWIYPQKLEYQVQLMEEFPEIALISSGMGILDKRKKLTGIRYGVKANRSEKVIFQQPLQSPSFPPIAHASSIIRLSHAKQIGYDLQFRTVEDVDFLLALALRYPYGQLNGVYYVYTEFDTINLKKILVANWNAHKMFNKYFRDYPAAVLVNNLKIIGKSVIYVSAFGVGLGGKLIRRRSQNPSKEDHERHTLAYELVANVYSQYFN